MTTSDGLSNVIFWLSLSPGTMTQDWMGGNLASFLKSRDMMRSIRRIGNPKLKRFIRLNTVRLGELLNFVVI